MHEFDPVMPSSDAHEDKLLRDTLLLLKQAKPKDNNKDQFMINIVSPPLSGSVDSETEKKEIEQKQMFSHDKVVSNKVTNDDNSAAKRSVERIDTEGKSLLEPDDFFDQTSTAAEDEFSLFNPQILETHATKTSVDYFIKKMEDDFLNPNTLPLNIIAMKLNTSIQELTNVIGLDVLLELQRSYEHPYQRMVKLLHIIASIELDDVSLPTVAHIFAKKAMQDLNEYNWPGKN